MTRTAGTRERVRRVGLALGLMAIAVAVVAPAATGAGAKTKRMSVSSAEKQANHSSFQPDVSATGRFVAFWSFASNLTGNDDNFDADVFVRDQKSGKTRLVSRRSSGAQGNGGSTEPSISGNGRFIAFSSLADNLVSGDLNNRTDVFVHDRWKGKTKLVSKDSNGIQANDESAQPAISANGRYVAFISFADNLVIGDTNGQSDVFVHDRWTGTTTLVSKSSGGTIGDHSSSEPAISANGRYVTFSSTSSNLIGADDNGSFDVFVHDRKSGKTKLVSRRSNGTQGNGRSNSPAISANGRFIAFESWADNLVKGDTNAPGSEVDVFVHDRRTHRTTRVSVSSKGKQANDTSAEPDISSSGRYVVFKSFANNLVKGDTNNTVDTFIHDRKTRKTRRTSVRTGGKQAKIFPGEAPSVSGDGRFAAFSSGASNLVKNDSNGEIDIFRRGPLH